jgi:hypothetical protein
MELDTLEGCHHSYPPRAVCETSALITDVTILNEYRSSGGVLEIIVNILWACESQSEESTKLCIAPASRSGIHGEVL